MNNPYKPKLLHKEEYKIEEILNENGNSFSYMPVKLRIKIPKKNRYLYMYKER
jgi:hypothetical protein